MPKKSVKNSRGALDVMSPLDAVETLLSGPQSSRYPSYETSDEPPMEGTLPAGDRSTLSPEQYRMAERADAKDRARTERMQVVSDFFIPDVASQREEVLGNEIQKSTAPQRVSGEYGLRREEIAQAGAADRQRIANQGLIGAAQARGRSGGMGGMGGGKPLSAGMLERVAGGLVSMDQLKRLRQLRGTGSVSTGPVSGRLQSFLQKMPLVPADKDFASFKAESDIFKNSTIRAVTGAQMSEPEAHRIIGQIPTENDKDEVWEAKAIASERAVKGLNIRIALLQQGVSPILLNTIPIEALGDNPAIVDQLLQGDTSGLLPTSIGDSDDLGANWGVQ